MVKLKDTVCFFCGKPIKATGKNLALCVDCDNSLSDEEKLRRIEFLNLICQASAHALWFGKQAVLLSREIEEDRCVDPAMVEWCLDMVKHTTLSYHALVQYYHAYVVPDCALVLPKISVFVRTRRRPRRRGFRSKRW